MFFKKVVLVILSLFDKIKRDNFWGPFLKASGSTTNFSIHFYSSEQSLCFISNSLEYLKILFEMKKTEQIGLECVRSFNALIRLSIKEILWNHSNDWCFMPRLWLLSALGSCWLFSLQFGPPSLYLFSKHYLISKDKIEDHQHSFCWSVNSALDENQSNVRTIIKAGKYLILAYSTVG